MNKQNPKTGRWARGTSGNPTGRPPGSRNKTTLLAEQLLEGEAECLTRTVVALAKKGNPAALRICLDRLLPVRKERPIHIELPLVQSAEDLSAGFRSIATAVAEGQITPGEGHTLSDVLFKQARVMELIDFERRVRELESFMSEAKAYRREIERLKDEAANVTCPRDRVRSLCEFLQMQCAKRVELLERVYFPDLGRKVVCFIDVRFYLWFRETYPDHTLAPPHLRCEHDRVQKRIRLAMHATSAEGSAPNAKELA
jgi:hypothetical protein